MPVTYRLPDGTETTEAISMDDYPGLYIAVELPPPGILIGRPPSDSNPELKVHLKGDPNEVAAILRPDVTLQHSTKFDWNAFNRVLAKIAHSYLVSLVGFDGYTPLLTGIILGTDPHFSHYIGGLFDGEEPPLYELNLSMDTCGPYDFLVVRMSLMGGFLPPYRVVAGLVTDRELIIRKTLTAQVS